MEIARLPRFFDSTVLRGRWALVGYLDDGHLTDLTPGPDSDQASRIQYRISMPLDSEYLAMASRISRRKRLHSKVDLPGTRGIRALTVSPIRSEAADKHGAHDTTLSEKIIPKRHTALKRKEIWKLVTLIRAFVALDAGSTLSSLFPNE
jgi:hypothetical protein